jgi:hypothetical protein
MHLTVLIHNFIATGYIRLANSSSIESQGDSNSSKPMEEGDLKLAAFEVGRLHLEKSKLSDSTRKPKC